MWVLLFVGVRPRGLQTRRFALPGTTAGRFFNRWTGYNARSRIWGKMYFLKVCGERIRTRDRNRQAAEIHIRIALMNRFSVLGIAEIIRVAQSHRGKGKSCLRCQMFNKAALIA